MAERFYLLKIRLLNVEPDVWRRFAVPSSIRLDELHKVIQVVMGWSNSHSYMFSILDCYYQEGLTPDEFEWEDTLNSREYRFGDVLDQEGYEFAYVYDIGDNWDHEVILEDNNYSNPTGTLTCIAGGGACPPEDVGGVMGYMSFCEEMEDPRHEGHEDAKEWFGGEFDRDFFDLKAINRQLSQLFKKG